MKLQEDIYSYAYLSSAGLWIQVEINRIRIQSSKKIGSVTLDYRQIKIFQFSNGAQKDCDSYMHTFPLKGCGTGLKFAGSGSIPRETKNLIRILSRTLKKNPDADPIPTYQLSNRGQERF